MHRHVRTLTIVSVCIAVSAVVGSIASRSDAQAGATTVTKVAVVNLDKVFDQYQRKQDLSADIDAKRREYQSQIEQQRDAIEAEQALLENLKPDSDEYQTRSQALRKQAIEISVFAEYSSNEIERELRRLTQNIYEELLEVVKIVADNENIDLVIYADEIQFDPQDDRMKLLAKIHQRKVLYASDNVDITDKVLEAANRRYKAVTSGQ